MYMYMLISALTIVSNFIIVPHPRWIRLCLCVPFAWLRCAAPASRHFIATSLQAKDFFQVLQYATLMCACTWNCACCCCVFLTMLRSLLMSSESQKQGSERIARTCDFKDRQQHDEIYRQNRIGRQGKKFILVIQMFLQMCVRIQLSCYGKWEAKKRRRVQRGSVRGGAAEGEREDSEEKGADPTTSVPSFLVIISNFMVVWVLHNNIPLHLPVSPMSLLPSL